MKRVYSFLFVFLIILFAGCTVDSPYSEPDYSIHTNSDERQYVTALNDLSDFSNSIPLLTSHTKPEFRKRTFSGWDENWKFDFRSCVVSTNDMVKVENMDDISFDSMTVWPDDLPDDFSPEDILEYNKNPGLTIRKLHESGVTGEGVSIAIIDQALYTEHEEYMDRLMSYEQIHCRDETVQMHGSAVVSIAAGETVGVAPDAEIYYIASTFGHYSEEGFDFDASILADCILRVCEINRYLPAEKRIRVISISRGYLKNSPGYDELQSAISKANEEGIFVLTTSTGEFYDFKLMGLARSYSANPDDPFSYVLPDMTSPGLDLSNFIFVPMGSRSYASYTGKHNYEINYNGGMSWAVPWFAGFYTLCCQVKTDITPQEFIKTVKKTVMKVPILTENGNRTVYIVDPCETINALRK